MCSHYDQRSSCLLSFYVWLKEHCHQQLTQTLGNEHEGFFVSLMVHLGEYISTSMHTRTCTANVTPVDCLSTYSNIYK